MATVADPFLISVDGAVAEIIINRPARRNALTLSMWKTLPGVVRALDEDRAVRVIVLRGAGSEAFSAGADISEFETERATPEAVSRYDAANEAAFSALRNARGPVIAAIEGYCMGGGMGLALACDLRIATESARFAIPAARLGIGYSPDWIADILTAVSATVAKDMLFTARVLDAREALRVGLVNAISSNLERDLSSITERIAANAPLSIRAAKRAIQVLSAPAGADRAALAAHVNACFQSQDYAEGRAAFLEKRAPVFKGE